MPAKFKLCTSFLTMSKAAENETTTDGRTTSSTTVKPRDISEAILYAVTGCIILGGVVVSIHYQYSKSFLQVLLGR